MTIFTVVVVVVPLRTLRSHITACRYTTFYIGLRGVLHCLFFWIWVDVTHRSFVVVPTLAFVTPHLHIYHHACVRCTYRVVVATRSLVTRVALTTLRSPYLARTVYRAGGPAPLILPFPHVPHVGFVTHSVTTFLISRFVVATHTCPARFTFHRSTWLISAGSRSRTRGSTTCTLYPHGLHWKDVPYRTFVAYVTIPF